MIYEYNMNITGYKSYTYIFCFDLQTTCFETNSGNSAFSGQENSTHDDDNSESGMEVDSLAENREPLLKTESEVKIPMTGCLPNSFPYEIVCCFSVFRNFIFKKNCFKQRG